MLEVGAAAEERFCPIEADRLDLEAHLAGPGLGDRYVAQRQLLRPTDCIELNDFRHSKVTV